MPRAESEAGAVEEVELSLALESADEDAAGAEAVWVCWLFVMVDPDERAVDAEPDPDAVHVPRRFLMDFLLLCRGRKAWCARCCASAAARAAKDRSNSA